MRKIIKRLLIVVVAFLGMIAIAGAILMSRTGKALKNQVNVAIDMNQVKDGTYIAESDGGMVKAKVEVTVIDHQIQDIKLIEHRNGKGKPAEAMLEVMIQENTYDVDCVSGATASSKTIRNAVNQALQQGLE